MDQGVTEDTVVYLENMLLDLQITLGVAVVNDEADTFTNHSEAITASTVSVFDALIIKKQVLMI